MSFEPYRQLRHKEAQLIDHPVDQVSAIIIGIAHREDDDEDKLIATVDGSVPAVQEIERELHFQEQFFNTTYSLMNTDAQQGGQPDATLRPPLS